MGAAASASCCGCAEAGGSSFCPHEGSFGAEDNYPTLMTAPCTPAAHERKRAMERKGTSARIFGRNTFSEDDLGEEHLAGHRRRRSKDTQTKELIKTSMKQNRVGALLEEPELESILQSTEYYEFESGDLVVEQGKMGTTFFVTQQGSLEVLVNGQVVNTLAQGDCFGGLALLYNCPRTATVKALTRCGVWGASGNTFHRVLKDTALKHYAENRQFLDSIRLFDGLTNKQKDRVGEAFFAEVFEAGVRVVTTGDARTALYFVKRGELSVREGGSVKASGEYIGGVETARLGPGDCLGEDALVDEELQRTTVISAGRCECVCISVPELKEILGDDLGACLERNFILLGLQQSPIMSQFSSSQQHEIVKAMAVRSYEAGAQVEDGLRFVVVVEGTLNAEEDYEPVTLERGRWYEDSASIDKTPKTPERRMQREPSAASSKSSATMFLDRERKLVQSVVAGAQGARLGVLTHEGLAAAFKELGLSALGSVEEASDYASKMVLTKKVHIFRHLSQEQTTALVKSFVLQRYSRGAQVIRQGEVGTSFFVIASGEVTVQINGKKVRTLAKNATFGERALLFDEPRTATIEVSSSAAEFWSVDKATFSQIVKGNMQKELMHRIRLQDTNLTLKDVRQVKVIGSGAAGVVRLVEHTKTQTRYALKRVYKDHGKIPEEVARECSLLAENDHPFIMKLVKTFETDNSVYMLTELITGGELHAAIRTIPTVLSRAHAQFYTGSLAIVLEELADRCIVFRDLKPENVMLDHQGYLKLIDFGIAKKLDEQKMRTFTMIGTPHYMAPEVMRGHGYGTEADLWSLGVMMYEFVCGRLPFADELDDPTSVCSAVLKDTLTFPRRYKDEDGKELMTGLLCRQPKKRLGAGMTGFREVREAAYFQLGDNSPGELFDKIMGRELTPPVVPQGETYGDDEDLPETLSDAGALGGQA